MNLTSLACVRNLYTDNPFVPHLWSRTGYTCHRCTLPMTCTSSVCQPFSNKRGFRSKLEQCSCLGRRTLWASYDDLTRHKRYAAMSTIRTVIGDPFFLFCFPSLRYRLTLLIFACLVVQQGMMPSMALFTPSCRFALAGEVPLSQAVHAKVMVPQSC